ncbi:hypothetical protein D3C81_1615580 [compost metagenome]
MATPAETMNCLAVTARTNSSLSRMKLSVAQICPAMGAETTSASTQAAGLPWMASKAPPMVASMTAT